MELTNNRVIKKSDFEEKENGVTLLKYNGRKAFLNNWQGRWRRTPRGVRGLKFCAQAICLKEMLCCDIAEGYLFYHETHRREKIAVTKELRQQVFEIFKEMNEYFDRGYTPKAKYSKKCCNCSLKDLCLPKMSKHRSVSTYYQLSLED